MDCGLSRRSSAGPGIPREKLAFAGGAGPWSPLSPVALRCVPVRIVCDSSAQLPVPCSQQAAPAWPVLAEMIETYTPKHVTALMQQSPALKTSLLEASKSGGPDCVPRVRRWLRWQVQSALFNLRQSFRKRKKCSIGSRGKQFQNKPRFRPFSVGSVRPLSWFAGIVERSAQGLAGRLFEFYEPVVDSAFFGGIRSYSSLHEDFPYAFHSLVLLAATARDPRLIGLCTEAVDKLLQSQGPDGWLGADAWPGAETVEVWDDASGHKAGLLSASLWARIPVLQGLARFIEAASQWRGIKSVMRCSVWVAIESFLLALKRRLDAGLCRLVAWSAARWPDLIVVMSWMLEYSSDCNDAIVATADINSVGCFCLSSNSQEQMIGLAWTLRIQGFDWAGWFHPARLPEGPVSIGNISLLSHGVNNAVAVKWGVAWASIIRNSGTSAASLAAWRQLRKLHGTISGGFTADEHLAGREPHRGTELCVVVELLRSLSYVYPMLFPYAPTLGDDLERLAFNALPAAVGEDHWVHQYLTQTNAFHAGLEAEAFMNSPTNGGPPLSTTFGNVGADATSYGLAPNFPCCLVNYGQGWPNILSSAWLQGSSGADHAWPLLVSAVFVPSSLELPQQFGGAHIVLETDYPFAPGSVLNYSISRMSRAFWLLVRIPRWVKLESTLVLVPGGAWHPLSAGEAVRVDRSARPTVLQFLVEQPGTWQVRFAARLQLEATSMGHVAAVTPILGPLAFVLPIAYHSRVFEPFENEKQERRSNALPQYPLKIRDEELIPLADSIWAFGLLPNVTSPEDESLWNLQAGALDQPSSSLGPSACKWRLSVQLVYLQEWQQKQDWHGERPGLRAPVLQLGQHTQLRSERGHLVPFGCAPLRLTTLPLLANQ